MQLLKLLVLKWMRTAGCNLSTLTLQAYKPCVRFNYADGNLPIELMFAEIECHTNSTIIKWASSSETNNDFYTIEKSTDAINFNVLDYIDGAGNSNQIINYSFVDNEQNPQSAYYRLSQTDFDGTTINLSTLYCNCNNSEIENLEILNVYQGDIDGDIYVSFNAKYQGEYTVSVVNMLGQTVMKQSGTAVLGMNDVYLNINKQASSMFFVLINTNKDKASRRFIYTAN